MTSEQEPIENLKQKSPDFYSWNAGGHEVSSQIIDSPRPKCGDKVICTYAEMGHLITFVSGKSPDLFCRRCR